MTSVVGANFESDPRVADLDVADTDWTSGGGEAASFPQEINDRRARWERAETLRLVRAL